MSDKDEIKELFQRELGNYESKVDPSLWQGIQSGISATTATASTTIGVGAKIAIGIISATIITVASVFIYNTVVDEVKTDKVITTEVKPKGSLENEQLQVHVENNEVSKKVENSLIDNSKGLETIKENSTEKDIEKQHSNKEVNLTEELLVVKNKKEEDYSDEVKINNKSQKNEVKKTKEEDNSTIVVAEKITEEPFITPTISRQENQYVVFEIEKSNIDEVVWDFGDGEFSREMKPEHFYKDNGVYNVVVKGYKDNEEIIKTLKVKVEIAGEFTNLPNSLTPNRDNVNDYLFVESKGIKTFQINVLNNKQEVIYQSSDVNFRWDGTMSNGLMVPEGRYIYIIIAKDEKGNTINKYQQLEIKR